jgi:hypothetical protein
MLDIGSRVFLLKNHTGEAALASTAAIALWIHRAEESATFCSYRLKSIMTMNMKYRNSLEKNSVTATKKLGARMVMHSQLT